MQDLIRRTMEVLRAKQVLRRLGVLISLTVIAIACYILFHLLRTIDVDNVIDHAGGTVRRRQLFHPDVL